MNRVIFGCGSQALYVLDSLKDQGEISPKAFVNLEPISLSGEMIEGVPVIDYESSFDIFQPGETEVIVAHGDNKLKLRIVSALEKNGFQFFSAVHPKVNISSLASVGLGCIVNAGVTILPRSSIHGHTVIHSGSVIEHDCVIGKGVNIGLGVIMAGRVSVGDGSYLFSGCTIGPGADVGRDAIVGAGSVVLGAVPDGSRVAGVPARVI